MEAFLFFGKGTSGPFQTVQVEVKSNPLQHHKLGLQYTASGYDDRIPSEYMIKYLGRWRRVYVARYGNAGSTWVYINGSRVSVDVWLN